MKGQPREVITDEELKKALRLSNSEEDNKIFQDILKTDYGVELTDKERAFIILYTNPLSKYINQKYKAIYKAGYAKSMADHILLPDHNVTKAIKFIKSKTELIDLEETIKKIVEQETRVYFADRTKLFTTKEFYDKDGNPHSITSLKDLDDINEKDKVLISNITKDKNGFPVIEVEKRSEARNFLMNYYKMQEAKNKPEEKKDENSIEITLEAIKDKVCAKINVIKQNDIEAQNAGVFIEDPKVLEEED